MDTPEAIDRDNGIGEMRRAVNLLSVLIDIKVKRAMLTENPSSCPNS